MRDRFKVFGSIIAATTLCLVAASASQAQDSRSREIIETDFAPLDVPLSGDARSTEAPPANLPPADASGQPVPVELLDDLEPFSLTPQQERAGGGDAASNDGGGASAGADGGGSGGGDSGGGGSGGDSGGGASGGDSGGGTSGGDSGGGKDHGGGKGHGKGGSKK